MGAHEAVAIILITVGLAIMIWGAFGFKTRQKVVDAGPFHISQDETNNVRDGAVAGDALALGGFALLLKSKS